jgi:excinuclease ABC subunit B
VTHLFELETSFSPCGDQPEAIRQLTDGFQSQKKSQVLLGITGSGKTFTMANVIAEMCRPTLIIAHNKTLAAQLYQEFKSFFPKNAVEYFVSYYDYYQPEAYIPRTDTYIEKDFAINDRIDKMRLSATRSLLEREDVIIIASVSCIYGLGSPDYYREMSLRLKVHDTIQRDTLLLRLVDMQYSRNDIDFSRSHFRSRGDVLDIFPAYEDSVAIRIEFFDEEIERILFFDPLTGQLVQKVDEVTIWSSSHFVTPQDIRQEAMRSIQAEFQERYAYFLDHNKLIEAQRLKERVGYDLEMIREVGFCKGIENYSRHFSKRAPGEPSSCLIDYFPKDFLLIIDESHQTLPQLSAMSAGDRARKQSLVEYGFRLPSSYDNRPLSFEEVQRRFHQVLYVSATPSLWELQQAHGEVVEQVIRPTGLLDPMIEVRAANTQVDDCLEEIRKEIAKGGKVLVTTLTKKLAEELTRYLSELNVRARYLHSDIDVIERLQILHALRSDGFDVLVGINLLREGLDLPEVTLVAILDADREGFLRSETSLIQTCGRASRNEQGRVIMYADRITSSIKKTCETTLARREKQKEYNRLHNITPKTVYRKKELLSLAHEEVVAFEKTEKKETFEPKRDLKAIQ